MGFRRALGLRRWCLGCAATGATAQSAGNAPQREQIQTETRAQEQVYGSQLMKEQERHEYSKRMGNATTEAQREQIRAEHHAQMEIRAKERGVKLHDMPPKGAKAQGHGPGGMGKKQGNVQGQGGRKSSKGR